MVDKEPIRILQENVIMDPGGIESLLMNLYRHIDRTKVQFDFLLHRPQEGSFDKEIEALGGRIYHAAPFNPFHQRKYLKSIKKILVEHPEYKIIHAHAELNYWPLKVAKKVGVPIRIAHSHNARSTINLKYLFLSYQKLFIKNAATDWFMCSSIAGEWSYGQKAVADGKCVFLKNGIEVDKYAFNQIVRDRVRREMNLDDKFVVGHVGRFMQQKNHSFLIDIFNELLKVKPNAVLILVSEGRLLQNIKEKVKTLEIEDKVLFLGFRNDVHDLMQAMDVFLLPSLWEGLPFTLVESQSSGLPSIISDVISDEATSTSLIRKVSLKEPASVWAKTVVDFYNSKERKDVSDQVKKAGFDIVETAKWLEDFYIKKRNECN